MKKAVFLIVSVLFVALSVNAQQITPNPFEGNTFAIDKYADNKLIDSEELSFQQTLLESSVYSRKNFAKTEYLAAQNNETGKWEFSCTMKNENNEKVTWHGTITSGSIEGNCIWVKGEEASIHYTFKGRIK